MNPTINSLIRECFLVGVASGHLYERIPEKLWKRLVRFGLDNDLLDPRDQPSDGWAVLALLHGPGNWGAEKTETLGADPAGIDWKGVAKRNGKHFCRGSNRQPFGGKGIGDFDVAALKAIYEKFGYPGPEEMFLDDGGHALAFDVVRSAGGTRWQMWVDWATELYEYDERVALEGGEPPVATWEVHYWIDEFWTPSWKACGVRNEWDGRFTLSGGRIDWPLLAASASVGARMKNSVKYALDEHLGKSADEIEEAYAAYKTAKRGKSAGERARKQARFARRLGPIVKAAQIEEL